MPLKPILILPAVAFFTATSCTSEPKPIEVFSASCDAMLERIEEAREELDCTCLTTNFTPFDDEMLGKLTVLFNGAIDQRGFERHFEANFSEAEMKMVEKAARECER